MHEEAEHDVERKQVRGGPGECVSDCVCVVSAQGLPVAPLEGTQSTGTPVAFFSLSQHLNASTLINMMHYLKATLLDPTRSFSTS